MSTADCCEIFIWNVGITNLHSENAGVRRASVSVCLRQCFPIERWMKKKLYGEVKSNVIENYDTVYRHG